VGLTLEEVFALGAQMGSSAAFINSSAILWAGMRTPTVLSPAVTNGEIAGFFFNIKVRGPGENSLNKV
jgi:hypothetical protein